MRLTGIQRTLSLFTFLIVVLLLNLYFSYRAITQLVDAESWLTHTYQVLNAIDTLEFQIQDMQTSADDFVITGKTENVAAFENHSREAGRQVSLLRQTTSDNPTQQHLISDSEAKLNALRDHLSFAIAARQSGKNPTVPTSEFLQAAMVVVGDMKAHEGQLLQQRSTRTANSLGTAERGLLVGSVATLILLSWVAWLIVSGEKQRIAVQESKGRLAAIVDTSEDAILSKTLDGTVLTWNHGAEKLYGYKAEEMIGKSIYTIIPFECKQEMTDILHALREGKTVEHLETKRLRRDGTQINVDVTVSPLKDEAGKVIGASAITRDVTVRKRMEDSLRQLSARILSAQDEERRRIARDIHDSTVQKLALLSMNLSRVHGLASDQQKLMATVQSAQDLAVQCAQELRLLSYLLHPPMLEELGLASALRIYAEGFSQRSGVVLDLDIEPEFARLPHEMEIALFRVAQESLSNILRHSGSQRAKIRLFSNEGIDLAIMDEGKGFGGGNGSAEAQDVQMGVGILGMTERMKQLGGTLTIDSGPTGTTVNAHLPYARRMDEQDPDRDRG